MERIKKKVVYTPSQQPIVNRLIQIYDEYQRNCDRQPQKLDKWTKWFLTETFVVLVENEIC